MVSAHPATIKRVLTEPAADKGVERPEIAVTWVDSGLDSGSESRSSKASRRITRSKVLETLEIRDGGLTLDTGLRGDLGEISPWMPVYLTSDRLSLYDNRIPTSGFEETTGLGVGDGVETSRCSLYTGDVTDWVGAITPFKGAQIERATEELLLAREMMLVSENASCKLICEVFRISLPESFMRGLNILITCCKVELDRGRQNLRSKIIIPVSMPGCPQRTTDIRDKWDAWATLCSGYPKGLPKRREDYRFDT